MLLSTMTALSASIAQLLFTDPDRTEKTDKNLLVNSVWKIFSGQDMAWAEECLFKPLYKSMPKPSATS